MVLSCGSVAIVSFSPTLSVCLLILPRNSQRVRGRVSFGTRFFVCLCDREFIYSISSAIVKDIKNMRDTRLALMAYYYFDYKDSSKRDIRGMLASLLFQLGCGSDGYWDVLY